MLKKLSVAALVAAMSFASVPAMISVAQAQGGANEPPTAPDPSDAAKGGGDMSKSGGDMSKGSMSSSKSMKKSKHHHHMKKHSSM